MSALDTAKTHLKYGYKVGTKSLALELTHADFANYSRLNAASTQDGARAGRGDGAGA